MIGTGTIGTGVMEVPDAMVGAGVMEVADAEMIGAAGMIDAEMIGAAGMIDTIDAGMMGANARLVVSTTSAPRRQHPRRQHPRLPRTDAEVAIFL